MTLALVGQSRKRRTALIAAGILAVVFAMFAGIAAREDAQAAPEYNVIMSAPDEYYAGGTTFLPNPGCHGDGSWYVQIHLSSQIAQYNFYIQNGLYITSVDTNVATGVPGGPVPVSWTARNSGGFQNSVVLWDAFVGPIPGSAASVTLTTTAYWSGNNQSDPAVQVFNRPCAQPGTLTVSKYIATGDPQLPWTKVTNPEFTFDVHVGSAAGPVIASGKQGTTITGLPIDGEDLYVTEQTGSGYSFVGFFKPAGQGDATCSSPGESVVPGAAGFLANTSASLFLCAYNAPPRTLKVVKLVSGTNAPAATFAGTISNGPDSSFSIPVAAGTNQTGSQTRSVDPGSSHTVTEVLTANQTTFGWSHTGYKTKAGINANCDGGADGNVVAADSGDYTVCVYNTYTPPPFSVVQVHKYVLQSNGTWAEQTGNPWRFTFDGTTDYAAFAGDQTQIAAGTYAVTEDASSSYTFNDIYVSANGAAGCTVPRSEGASTTASVSVPAGGGTLHLCAFNTPKFKTTNLKKVVVDKDGNRVTNDTTQFFVTVEGTTNPNSYLTGDSGAFPYTSGSTPGFQLRYGEVVPGGYVQVAAFLLKQRDGDCWANRPAFVSTTPPNEVTTPVDPGYYTVCFVNMQVPNGKLVIKKVNEGGTASDGFTADIAGGTEDIAFSASANSAEQALAAGVYTVTEDAKSGYAYKGFTTSNSDSCSGTPATGTPNQNVTVTGGQTTYLCFYNQRQSTITIAKKYVAHGVLTVQPNFYIGDQAASLGNNVVAPGQHHVSETAPEGWTNTLIELSDGCAVAEPLLRGDYALQRAFEALTGSDGKDVTVQPGATCTVTFTNERDTGRITVVKQVVPDPNLTENGLFNLSINGTNYATDVSDGGTTGSKELPTGSYTVGESAGSGTDLSRYSSSVSCSTNGGPGTASPVVELKAGENVVCTFTNRRNLVGSAPTLIVRKFSDPNGNLTGSGGLFGGWPITITGTSGAASGKSHTVTTESSGPGLGVATFAGIEEGTWTVSEPSATPGFKVVGSKLNGGSTDNDHSRDGVVTAEGLSPTVDFYNQPIGSIVVTKTTILRTNGILESDVPADRDGWKISISSAACGVSEFKFTDAAGTATFDNLPGCTDYAVKEEVGNSGTSGYVVIGSNPVNGVTPGTPATAVAFLNRREMFVAPCATCNIVSNPTATPTAAPTTTPAASATATAPAATATPATPTAVSTVRGERTPSSAPLPPNTGSGAGNVAGTTNLLVAGLGLLVLAAGVGMLRLGQRWR